MSKYTTGEIAKLCGTTVRTVQYYDTRNLLVPSQLTEGGRRLYSDEDLKRMRIICFLREMDLSINTISELLTDEHPEAVIGLLLEQQSQTLRKEIDQQQSKLDRLEELKRGLKSVEQFSIEAIDDVAHTMKHKKTLKKVRFILLAVGIPMELLGMAMLIFAIQTGIWWPFLLEQAVNLGIGTLLFSYHYRRINYICPKCHAVFRPGFTEALFADHTPTTRKLTCTACGCKGFCVETGGDD